VSSKRPDVHRWWHSLNMAERCRILVDSGIPELECLGLHLSGRELTELPLLASRVVEASWARVHARDLDHGFDCC
jgi:hypothetical protein